MAGGYIPYFVLSARGKGNPVASFLAALATEPRLLMLDEPVAGMNPNESRRLLELIKQVKEEFRLAILLIEHDMHFVMNICERIVVLDHGVEIAQDRPEEIRANPRVVEAYLGEDWADA